MSFHQFRLGIVEGFYGKPWTWEERASTAEFMKSTGMYSFYLYCPKGDAFLRKRWREAWPQETATAIRTLANKMHGLGLTFGVGLSPHELTSEPFAVAEKTLLRRAEEIISLGVDHLAILFDDMRGDLPGLAGLQIAAVNAIHKRWPKLR